MSIPWKGAAVAAVAGTIALLALEVIDIKRSDTEYNAASAPGAPPFKTPVFGVLKAQLGASLVRGGLPAALAYVVAVKLRKQMGGGA